MIHFLIQPVLALALATVATDHSRPHLAAGKLAYGQGNHDKAIHELKKAAHDHPESSEIWMWLGRALGRKAENSNPLRAVFMVGEVRQAFEKAVQLDPRNIDARGDLLDFYLEAPGAFGGGLDKARVQAAAINSINPADGFYANARIDEKEEKFVSAERALKSAIQLDPSPGRYRELGQFFQRRKKYGEMEAAYRQSGDTKSQYYLATGLLEQGQRLREAQELVKKFLAAPAPEPGDDPTLADAHLLLGKIDLRLGHRDEALKELRAALEQNPAMKAAKKEMEGLR